MKHYEFYYSVLYNAVVEEANEVFRCDGFCLKHALIKLARFFASLSDYSPSRYQVATDYAIDDYNWQSLSNEDFMFMFYYIEHFRQYSEVANNG